MNDAAPAPGKVRTCYGDLPGCPTCGLVPLRGPLLCEHGVTPAPAATELACTLTIADRGLYDRLTGGRPRGHQPPQSP